MDFNEALRLIDEQKIIGARIEDYKGKSILKFVETNPTELKHKLESYKNALSAYGKVTFIVGDEKTIKNLWREALHWDIGFSGITTQQNLPMHTGIIPGMISATEAELKLKILELTQKHEFEKRMAEMEAKFDKKKDSGDDFIKYLPLLGLFVKVPKDKLDQMVSMGHLMNVMNGTQQVTQQTTQQTQQRGMAGLETVKEAELKRTPEEEKLIEEIENELADIMQKVQLTSIRDFLSMLNKDPSLIGKLETLIQTFLK